MKNVRIIVFDPSGNMGKNEGYGTSGYAVFDNGELKDWGIISSKDFETQEEYWDAHKQLLFRHIPYPHTVVCESYNLQGNKALSQTGSSLDTPQLIGFLRMVCWSEGIEWIFQHPQDKARVADPILVREGVFEQKGNRITCQGKPTVIHSRDAIRHGIYFHRYGKGKRRNENT